MRLGRLGTRPRVLIVLWQGLLWHCKIDYSFPPQEVDGESLLSLNPERMVKLMDLKTGPALRIYNKITALKQQFGIHPLWLTIILGDLAVNHIHTSPGTNWCNHWLFLTILMFSIITAKFTHTHYISHMYRASFPGHYELEKEAWERG